MDKDLKRMLLSIVLSGLIVFGLLLVRPWFVHKVAVETVKEISGAVAAMPAAMPKPAPPPEWITVKGRSKEECLAESGGVLDAHYIKCRDGWKEQVVFRDGRKVVLQTKDMYSRFK